MTTALLPPDLIDAYRFLARAECRLLVSGSDPVRLATVRRSMGIIFDNLVREALKQQPGGDAAAIRVKLRAELASGAA